MTLNESTRPDVGSVLATLKDFQLDTVDYVFRRLYTDEDQVSRFLIADEVGLGKTLVARGIIARAIDHLWETRDENHRIDVVYICSNQAIAQQNIDRLNVAAEREFQFASRLTLLPATVKKLQENKLNFVSLTPTTSFDLRTRGGRWEERAVLYMLLREHWRDLGPTESTLRNVLRGTVHKRNFKRYLESFEQQHESGLDEEIKRAFHDGLEREPAHRARYEAVAAKIGSRRVHLTDEVRWERDFFVGELRRLLARASVASLEPDLVILDEFQRFKYVLEDEGEIALLAREMFDFPGARVLLLSATPYKMYTLRGEADEDHYKDFFDTVKFLLNGRVEALDELKHAIARYRDAMLHVGLGTQTDLRAVKTAVEDILLKVMVRTERLAVSADRNGMLEEAFIAQDRVQSEDLAAFVHLDHLATALEAGDQVEYWKSGSYLPNLMDGYQLKRKLETRLAAPDPQEVGSLLQRAQGTLLNWDEIEAYRVIDPANARLRALWSESLETGNWQLLWMPPALPYYQPGGPFDETATGGHTKTLVFSAWKLVPKTIAVLLSYEAERRMLEEQERDFSYDELTVKRKPLLTFTRSQGRLTGMPVFCLTYPCLTLAQAVDPLALARSLASDSIPHSRAVFEAAKARIGELLREAIASVDIAQEGRADEAWYWAALALLDRHFHPDSTEEWLATEQPEFAWRRALDADSEMDEEERGETRFVEHVAEFTERFDAPGSYGPPPDDLLDVLVGVALAGPAVSSLRASLRILDPQEKGQWAAFLASAAGAGLAFRTLFNQPEAISLLQTRYPDGAYWQKVLRYCLDGNLQAVMDEYYHVLHESLGLVGHIADESVVKLGSVVRQALSIRAPTLRFDEIRFEDGRPALVKRGLRCRYALRFGDEKSADYDGRTRDTDVRVAFNSPFRPFVLATTSIGQEGLDFHQYCHRIVHWNLPSNPVDLEQREGRIHRYKGHVIRRNLALDYGLHGMGSDTALGDPWKHLFERAMAERPREANDLIPFWIYETQNTAGKAVFKIERRVPVLPLSREISHLADLKRSLVAYRSVIGQPRQQELLEFLSASLGEQVQEFVDRVTIDLGPPRAESGA